MTHRSYPMTLTFTQTDALTVAATMPDGTLLANLTGRTVDELMLTIGHFVWWGLESVDDPPDVEN